MGQFIKHCIERKISGTYNLASSTNISLESISELFKVDNAIFGSYKYETGIIDISKVSNETSIFSKTSLEVVEFYNNLRSEQNE